jgi:S-adenosylmethionine-diacylglycerol 3-amino-3-carboxypropyl transferase
VRSYARLRPQLSPAARAFWDAHREVVAAGVIHGGKFERYLRLFRRALLPLVHRRRTMERLVESKTPTEQRRFYAEEWDTARWRLIFRIFFSRAVMGRLGRDPALFDHVEGDGAAAILARTRHALSEIPASTNPYLVYIMTGSFRPDALPRYLRPEHRSAIRERLDRLTLVRSAAEAVPGPFDGFNLSDIFEYLGPAEHERVYRALVDHASPGARLVYWNMLAPRERPPSLADRVMGCTDESARLHLGDRAWFYQRLQVDEVVA